MPALFEHILNPLLGMSLTAAFVAVVVILLRLVLKKRAPKQVVCLLWLLVFARLLVPVMVESPISLVPPVLEDVVPGQVEQAEDPTVPDIGPGYTEDAPANTPAVPETPAPTPGNVITTPSEPVVSQPGNTIPQNPVTTPPVTEDPTEPEPPAEEPVPEEPAGAPVWMTVLPAVWLAGVAVMLVVGIGSYVKLRRQVYDAIRTEDGVWEHPSLASPFILGLFRPKIYLPMGIGGQPRQFILQHERAHLRRLDHVVKPICWVALAIHWFNPLAWVAFLLMSRDIESACDESVIRKLGSEVKADYSATLLALATDKRFPSPSPLSFGEGDAKARIKNVLNFKKPALWVTIAAVVVAVIAAVCLLTDPVTPDGPDLSGYTTREEYPGLYFLEEDSSTVGKKITAWKLVDGELVLVGGYEEHMANNFDILIHADGEPEAIWSSQDVQALFEALLAEACLEMDPNWMPGTAGNGDAPVEDPAGENPIDNPDVTEEDDPIGTPNVTEPELYFSVTPVAESAANGLFTQFQLTYEGNSVVFDGRAVENEMRAVWDCSSADLNGDGVQELIVSLVTAYGTGVLEQELHIFDSRTLEEYPADGLAEQLAALFTFTANDSAFFITADHFSAAIPKDQLDFGFSVVLLDRISIGENFRYTVEDGKLYCVFSCCVAEGWNYYGELWVELGIDLLGSVVPRGYQLRVDGEVREDSDYPPSDLGELFLSALNDKVEIVDPGLGMTDTLSELVKATAPTVEIHITEMAAVDLDGNGSKELLLKLETPSIGYGTMILRYDSSDGRIYSYVLWFRAFNDVKTDGTFSYSGGASVNGIARISFTPGGYEQEKITYSEWNYPDPNVYFCVNKQPATEDEFLDAFDAWRETPGVTWTEYTPENAEALIREHFEVTNQAPPGVLGFLGSLPSEIVTSDTLPSDPEEYYLVAQLPESYVWLYARNHGQDSMLLWNGNFWWPLEGRVAHTGHMNLPQMFLLEDTPSTTTVAVISQTGTGTGVNVNELAAFVIGEFTTEASNYSGMQDYVYDWRPVAEYFNKNNTLVYDAETNSLTLLWNGAAYCTGTLGQNLGQHFDLEDGFTGALVVNNDIICFEHNGGSSFTITVEPCIAEGGQGHFVEAGWWQRANDDNYCYPMSVGVTGFALTWTVEFTGSGFEASAPTITVTGKEQTALKAAFPEEGIYLFSLGNGGEYYYLFEGGQLHKVDGAGTLTDLDVNCRLVDLDGDGQMELAVVGNHYAGSSSFGLLNVFDKDADGWQHYRLPSDTPDYVSPFGEHDLMEDAATFTIGSDPTQVTMHLSGFDFLFTVSDEVASRSGDYYVWDGGCSITWEGDGYYLRLNGSIHRHGGQYGWPSDDCGVTFQIVCRLEYNADGIFEQIPTGIVQSVSAPQKKLAAATKDFYIIDSDSRLIMFGSPEGTWPGSGLGNVPAESPVELIGLMDTAGELTYVDAGIYGGVMAVDTNGVLWGHGTYADPDRPTEPVRLLENVAMVSCGQFDSYILRRDGSLWSYDHNNTGLPTLKTMGVNGVTYYKLMDNVISVEAGGYGSGHVILPDHTLWAWGQMGEMVKVADNVASYSDGRIIDLDGNLLDENGAVLLTGVKYANYHYAIKTDGTLWALTTPDPDTLWGRGTPLGKPRYITDNVDYLASGEFESILMKWDGSIWKLTPDGTLTGVSFVRG